jgi:hypothetical protein
MNNIRQYILESTHTRSGTYWTHFQYGSEGFQNIRDIADSSANLARDAAGMMQGMADKKLQYERSLDYAVRALANEERTRLFHQYLNPENERDRLDPQNARAKSNREADIKLKEWQNMLRKGKVPKEILNSRDYNMVKLGQVVANWNLAVQGVNVAQAGFENLSTIGLIVHENIKKQKIKDDTVVECEDILNEAYKLKDEGEKRFKELQTELKKLNESFFGFFKSSLQKIVDFFTSPFKPKTDKLLAKARRIRVR